MDAHVCPVFMNAPHTIVPWALRKKVVVNTNGLDWERSKWGRAAKQYFKTGARISVTTGQALVSDSLQMQVFYEERFNRRSVFIPYGAEIQTSTNPDVVRQYGLEPGARILEKPQSTQGLLTAVRQVLDAGRTETHAELSVRAP